MATYIVLANFTEQGIRTVKETAKRAEAFRMAAQQEGITIKDTYWTLGTYDMMITLEAPDDMTVTALGLSIGQAGNLRTQTLRAFSAEEMAKILPRVK
jgi:uncharacterized protein with GYD domain